jgi:hypothetical protein
MNRTNNKPVVKRIKPIGWLMIGLLGIVGLTLVALLLRPLTADVRTLPMGVAAHATASTITPYAQSARTALPMATPLPTGWAQGKGLDGQPNLVPPEDVKQKIEAVFATALACNYAEDAEDASLLASPPRGELCAAALAVTADQATVIATPVPNNARQITRFGTINLSCASTTRCQIARAKLGITGMIMDQPQDCAKIKINHAPCLYRQTVKGLPLYEILIASMAQENGTWKITAWRTEELPGPPPSSAP